MSSVGEAEAEVRREAEAEGQVRLEVEAGQEAEWAMLAWCLWHLRCALCCYSNRALTRCHGYELEAVYPTLLAGTPLSLGRALIGCFSPQL